MIRKNFRFNFMFFSEMSDVKQEAKLVTRHLIGYSPHTYKLTNTYLHYLTQTLVCNNLVVNDIS